MHECFANPERNDGFGADSNPSRDDPCRRALRPIATSIVPICNVRFTSTPAERGVGSTREFCGDLCFDAPVIFGSCDLRLKPARSSRLSDVSHQGPQQRRTLRRG
jgi:hypothetical protein